MALFGFKKKKKPEIKKEEKISKLNRREYNRYIVQDLNIESVGKVINISKNGAEIEKTDIDEIGNEALDVKLENFEVEGAIKRETLKVVGVNFENELLDADIIKNHLVKYKNYNFNSNSTDFEIEFGKNHSLEKTKAVINLMLELDDPNTNVEKFKSHIEAIPELEILIFKKANSVESASRTKIDSINTAITRLGFEEIKRVVYDFINRKITFKNCYFNDFEHFEFYNILKLSLFKKLAPLFSFNDIRSEGRSLLATETVGVDLLLENAPNGFKNLYKSPKELYSHVLRVYEDKFFGINLLDLNRDYFVNRMGLFKYLYDGYLLAHQSLHPYYEFKDDQEIILSSRKLRFSYVSYLTFLALQYIISKDKRSGYMLLNRLIKLGLNTQKALSFLNKAIHDTNEKLKIAGVDDKIGSISFPSFKIKISDNFGKTKDIEYFIEKLTKVSNEHINRVAFRYEDSFAAMKLINNVINSIDFNFNSLPFCVIPCHNLKDDELKLELFNGFDLVIFKDIEKLPKNLFKDFRKLWRDFEGKIFVTFSTYSMIDFYQKELFLLIRDFIVDIPSFAENKTLYKRLLEKSCNEVNEIFKESVCSENEFESELYTIDSVYKKVIDNL